jgi:hypothetical protein
MPLYAQSPAQSARVLPTKTLGSIPTPASMRSRSPNEGVVVQKKMETSPVLVRKYNDNLEISLKLDILKIILEIQYFYCRL